MATYVSTIKFTAQGATAITDTAKRANAFKSSCKEDGREGERAVLDARPV